MAKYYGVFTKTGKLVTSKGIGGYPEIYCVKKDAFEVTDCMIDPNRFEVVEVKIIRKEKE